MNKKKEQAKQSSGDRKKTPRRLQQTVRGKRRLRSRATPISKQRAVHFGFERQTPSELLPAVVLDG